MRAIQLKPREIPLLTALETCQIHGIDCAAVLEELKGEPNAWRELFLLNLWRKRVIKTVVDEMGLYRKLIYAEANDVKSFKRAVDMCIGKRRWSERIWNQALEEARQRDADAVASGEDDHEA